MSKIQNNCSCVHRRVLVICILVIRICFEFRYSDFEFPAT
ncbi:hypothetical protein D1AOALGA4SA_2026 [Olavius algarvensis Delta 1 endosymbiont]|nr:hypothetical protein D1AOALGA4SA_2026 [Olavius algarvensis Delta 1 endosymbiont]